jgi:hypothetical protein
MSPMGVFNSVHMRIYQKGEKIETDTDLTNARRCSSDENNFSGHILTEYGSFNVAQQLEHKIRW